MGANGSRRMTIPLAALVFATAMETLNAAEDLWREPPAVIVETLEAAPTPVAIPSPVGDRMLLAQSRGMPSIAEMAAPMLRLAGVRIDPLTNGRHGAGSFVSIRMLTLGGGEKVVIDLPEEGRFSALRWSQDGKYFAFTNQRPGGAELWIGDGGNGNVRRIDGVRLNDVLGSAFTWMPDARRLLCRLVPQGRGDAPEPSSAPLGPIVQETAGAAAPQRTYQDLITTPIGEAQFAYYATAQLAIIDAASADTVGIDVIGTPAVYLSTSISPDGKCLLVKKAEGDFSYLVPYYRFARLTQVWDMGGKLMHTIARQPADEAVPIQGVPMGPRSVQWRPDKPATLIWAEALDGGDPKAAAKHRDRMMTVAAPFVDEAREVLRLEHRYRGLTWRPKGDQALISEYDRDRRWNRTWLAKMDEEGAEPRLVWDLSVQDAYGDPGSPLTQRNAAGKSVLLESDGAIFLRGRGASPQGDRPFLDKMDLASLETQRLFHCGSGVYESVVALLGGDEDRLLTRRESKTEPPNYFLRKVDAVGGDVVGGDAITHFADPAPWLKDIRKELVTYQRADGVGLSGTMYYPIGYEEGKRYPMVVWAYPREFNDAKVAGMVRGSPHRFTTVRGASHLFFLTQGYAVFDGPTLPVVGDPETANNEYINQIVAGARAAIDKAVEMGVADRERVGAGGHSYGAFMTANLLAHSDLFAAGIARSGAYNRTLTPFGFQAERRTFWEAPEIYFSMSPFMHADQVNEPILLIHGEVDNNSGTFPIQSKRFYHALKGHGATARYVVLPHESHGYRARESVLHALAEMLDWFKVYVKDGVKPPAPQGK